MYIYSCFGKYEDLQNFLDDLPDCDEMGYSNLLGELRIKCHLNESEIKKIADQFDVEIILVRVF